MIGITDGRTAGNRACDQPPGTRTKTWEMDRSDENLVIIISWDGDPSF